MKSIIALKSVSKFKFVSSKVKHFSLMEICRERFPLNTSVSTNDIVSEKFETLHSRKSREFKKAPNKIVKRYLMEDQKKSEIKGIIPKQSEVDLDQPVLLSRKIEKIVDSPHLINMEIEELSQNANLFYDILFNSSYNKNISAGKDLVSGVDLSPKSALYLLKYIKIINFNFPLFLQDKQIYGIIKHCLEHFSNNVPIEREEFFNFFDFYFEAIQLKDKLFHGNKSPENTKLIIVIENYITSKFNSIQIKKCLNFLLSPENGKEKEKMLQYFFKFIFILARSSLGRKNPNFFKHLLNSSNFIKEKERLSDYLESMELHKSIYFKNDKEKTIIFYLCLKKLKLLTNEIIRNINFDHFSIDSFHVFFSSMLSSPEYITEINSESVINMFMMKQNELAFYSNFNVRKAILMRETIDWNINTNLCFINFQNQHGSLQTNRKTILQKMLQKFIDNLPNITNPEEIIHVSYILSAYSANPGKSFETISEKNFDIEEVNTDLLNKFIESVDMRLNYFIRYDHEIHILKKLKKDLFIPYEEQLDKIIIYMTKQFFYKVENDTPMTPELFEIGLKCLKIIFNVDMLDPNYKISESIQQGITSFVSKCFTRGSKYLRYMSSRNVEIMDTLTEIIPHLKYFFDLSSRGIKNKSVIGLFENFILNISKQEYSKVEDKLTIMSNIAEFIIIDSILKTSQDLSAPNYSETINYIYKQIEGVFINHKIPADRVVSKLIMESEILESEIPPLLINLYNIFSFDKDKYTSFLTLLENYITSKKGLRNLKGYELLKLKKEIMNENTLSQILSNLQTIQTTKTKENINANILNNKILKSYALEIQNYLKEYKSSSTQLNLTSFSYLASNIFDSLSTEETVQILKVLGNRRIENYHPSFVKVLVEKYSDRNLIFDLMKKKENLFFELALSWPLFIKNEELVRSLLHCHMSKLLQFSRYEIINLLSFNHINHSKLLSYFGSSIKKIKNPMLKKKVLNDFLNMSTYVGFKTDIQLYEELLALYQEIEEKNKFDFPELVDFIVLGVNSSILDTSLSNNGKKAFFEILKNIHKQIEHKLTLKINKNLINYYPSIPSEDKYFAKSLSNLYASNEEINEDFGDETEDKDDKMEEEARSYMRKSREGQATIDLEFENYFTKKKEILYGYQNYLNDDYATRLIFKKWCVAKLFKMKLEDEYLLNQLNQILNHYQSRMRLNPAYQKFYLKMLSYGFQYNFTVDSDYKEPMTGFRIDYSIDYNDKKHFIIIIPENHTSISHEENKKHPDGIYTLIIECIKNITNVNLIAINEAEMTSMDDGENHTKILNKIVSH